MIFEPTIDNEAIVARFAYFPIKRAFRNPKDYEIPKKVNDDFWLKIECVR